MAGTIEEFPIPRDDIGTIIGKGGCTIRELQSKSGCQISVDKLNSVARLRGSRDCVAKAKQLLTEIVGGEGVEVVSGIDELAMGFLTRSLWLEGLKEKLGIEIRVDRRALRIYTDDPDKSSVQEARRQIEQRIAESSEVVEEAIPCDAKFVRTIREDLGLSQLRDTRGLQMDISKTDSGTNLTLKGLRGVVDVAIDSVRAIIKGEGSSDFVPLTEDLLTTDCPYEKLDDLKRDVKLHVEQEYGVRVQDFAPGSTRVMLLGPPGVVGDARMELQKILQYYFADNCFSMPIPRDSLEWVCGPEDRYLIRMQSMSLVAAMDRERALLWLCGRPKEVENAVGRVERSIETYRNSDHYVAPRGGRGGGRGRGRW